MSTIKGILVFITCGAVSLPCCHGWFWGGSSGGGGGGAAAPAGTTLPPLHEDATKYQALKPTLNFSLEWSNVSNNGRTYPVSLVWFHCNFEPSLEEDLLYSVTWYNNRGVHHSSELAESADDWRLRLNETKYIAIGFNMGDNLSCSVTAYKEEDGPPGRESEQSEQTLVGIKILTQSVTSNSSDDDIVIKIQPTVPISCRYEWTCKVYLTMYIPESTCRQSVISKEKSCGVELFSANWSNVYEIPLEKFSRDEYERSKDFNVYLSSFNDTSNHIMWSAYKLEPIKIHVRRSSQQTYEGKLCYSRNDPHLNSFDGRKFDNHQEGTFIMYRHTHFETEVQVQYKTCQRIAAGAIKCNCGVAVRSGFDIFIIDTCDQAQPRLGYTHCDALGKTLVATRIPGNKYQISFSYGTYVSVSLVHMYGSWLLEVHVIPSKADQGVDKTVGLCGRLDGDCSNDFHYPNGSLTPGNLACEHGNNTWTYDSQPLAFINSWKITDPTNEMFSDDYRTPNMAPMNYSVCSCTKDPQYAGPTNIITCDKDIAATCTQGQLVVGSHSCSTSRRRRSVTRKQSIPKFNTESSTDRFRRDIPDEPFSQEEATMICTKSLTETPIYTLCEDVPSVKPYESVEICVQDLMMTGDKSWVSRSLANMQDACTMELRRNKTFSEAEPTGRAIAEQIVDEACPNNCSSRGLCIKGSCQCDEGWCGGDCFLDASSPLRLAGILDDGLCDEFELTCDYAYVFGDVFSDVDQLTCRLEEFFILSNGVREYGNTHHVLAETETMFETRCPLASSRRRREVSGNHTDAFVSGFTISISNNGTVYSNGVDLFIFNSECQLIGFSVESVYLSVKPGYCFIEGQCLKQGFPHPTRNCTFCDSEQSGTAWSFVEDGQDCVLSRDDYLQHGALIAVCLVVFAIFALAFAAILYYKIKTTSRNQIDIMMEPEFSKADLSEKVAKKQFDPGQLITSNLPVKCDNHSLDSGQLQTSNLAEKVANHTFDPGQLKVSADVVKPLCDCNTSNLFEESDVDDYNQTPPSETHLQNLEPPQV